jgi:hypothetical protein
MTACSSPTPPPPTATLLPTDTPLPPPTETPLPPTATFTPAPTETATPVPFTPTWTFTPVPSATLTKIAFEDAIWVYYIAPADKGGGCGEEAVPFSIGLPKTGLVANDAAEAIRRLLSYRNPTFGNYFNPIGYSAISLNSVEFDAGTGNLTVMMNGTYTPPEGGCDASHVKMQVFRTARQFKEVKGTDIMMNGVAFNDILARKQK